MTNPKIISVIYKNKNTTPVNKQAVHEFFRDHDSVAPDFSDKRPTYNVSIKHFKKATGKLREPVNGDLDINLDVYERACIAIRKSDKSNLPYKYNKLVGWVMHFFKCNKKMSILVINKMCDERFIRVNGNYVQYF